MDRTPETGAECPPKNSKRPEPEPGPPACYPFRTAETLYQTRQELVGIIG